MVDCSHTVCYRNTWTRALSCETETISKPVIRLTEPGKVLCRSHFLGECCVCQEMPVIDGSAI